MTELLRQKLFLTFPVPAGRYCRSFRTDGANYGKCPSKKETYYGFKVHVLITLENYISAFEIMPAFVDGRAGLRDLSYFTEIFQL